jgi:hypothetical protein
MRKTSFWPGNVESKNMIVSPCSFGTIGTAGRSGVDAEDRAALWWKAGQGERSSLIFVRPRSQMRKRNCNIEEARGERDSLSGNGDKLKHSINHDGSSVLVDA